MTTDTLVSLQGTCTALGGISRPTLYRLIEAGELSAVPIGRRRFVPASQIDAYIERHQGSSRSPEPPAAA